jgi:hypothetical protein
VADSEFHAKGTTGRLFVPAMDGVSVETVTQEEQERELLTV